MAAALNSVKPADAIVSAREAMRLDPSNRGLYSLWEGGAYVLMGRYKEAMPPLKMYLAHYSNFILAHLMLIACYVELGRNEEARAEAAEVMRLNPQFSLAVQKQMVGWNEPPRDHLFSDMAKAGLK